MITIPWTQLLAVMAPAVLKSVPGIPPAMIPFIVKAILAAEANEDSLTGAEKKDQVLEAVEAQDHKVSVTALSHAIDSVVNAANAIFSHLNPHR